MSVSGRGLLSETRLPLPIAGLRRIPVFYPEHKEQTRMQRDACDYPFNAPGPGAHYCMRTKGHPSRHVCWCGALHDAGADYTGRWESYVKPELRGESRRKTDDRGTA